MIQLGLSKKEAEVYLTLLELGQSPASAISKKLQLKRTTVYSIISSLKERGFVGACGKKGLFCYAAMDPEVLLERYNRKIQHEQRNFVNVSKSLSQLSTIFRGRTLDCPEICLFEGLKGVKSVVEDTLSAKRVLMRYSSLHKTASRAIMSYLEKCDQIRVYERGVFMRVLVYGTERVRAYWQKYSADLVDVRWVDERFFAFDNEIFIYNDKVVIVSLKEEEMFGIFIKNKLVARTQKKIFELAWAGAKVVDSEGWEELEEVEEWEDEEDKNI